MDIYIIKNGELVATAFETSSGDVGFNDDDERLTGEELDAVGNAIMDAAEDIRDLTPPNWQPGDTLHRTHGKWVTDAVRVLEKR